MTDRPERGLLDTSTVILLGRLADPERLPRTPLISTITLAELSAGPLLAADPAERAARQAHLQQAETDFEPVPFDEAAARAFATVATDLRAAGRKVQARAFDALIAAVALANRLPLFTVNSDDFVGIRGLDLRPVEHPDSRR